MRKNIIVALAMLLAGVGQAFAYSTTMAKTVKGEYSGKADTLVTVLINQFMNTSKGTFWSTPSDKYGNSTYIYWQQAHAMDVIVYAYERHKDDNPSLARKYKNYMQSWFNNKANNYAGSSSGYMMFENPYTDDMLWICLTLLHMTEATGTASYATAAKNLYNNVIMKRLKEDDRGKWLPWNTDANSGPNSCTEGPACLVSAKLFEKYQDSTYLDNALMFYNFMTKNICKSDGRCEEPPLTYTQGTFGEACRRLYHITGKSTFKNNAKLYINYAFTSGRCTNGSNILRHEGTSMDQAIFKAVLMPYAVNFVLDEKMELATRRSLSGYIQKNADTLWGVLDKSKYSSKQPNGMYCNYDWTKPWDYDKPNWDGAMGAMASGASLFENCARMCIGLTYNPDEDGIEVITAATQDDDIDDDSIYSLDGRVVGRQSEGFAHLKKGIYIINKKKVQF